MSLFWNLCIFSIDLDGYANWVTKKKNREEPSKYVCCFHLAKFSVPIIRQLVFFLVAREYRKIHFYGKMRGILGSFAA